MDNSFKTLLSTDDYRCAPCLHIFAAHFCLRKWHSQSSIIAADGDHRPLALADRGSIIFAVTSLKR